MFRKLVSNLPFSPALINQIGFYSKRLKKEQFTRKFGLVFTVLALIIQSLTFIAPAKASLAANGNDIVYGGGSKEQLLNTYRRGCDNLGRCDIRAIFNAYGINETNLANATYQSIFSSPANHYWSIGRLPRGYGGEYSRQIPGGPTIWARTLDGWKANINWNAIRVETSQGVRWILTECGNVVTQEGLPAPTPVTYPPDIETTKTVDKPIVNKGDKVTFTIKVTNIGKGMAKNVLIYDDSPVGIDLLNDGLGTQTIKNTRRWETHSRFDIAPGQSFTYRISALITRWGPVSLTNKACADIFDINIYNNCSTAKIDINSPCLIPGKENLPKNDPQCKTNPSLVIEKTSNQKEVKVGDIIEYNLKVTNKGDIDLPKAVVRDVAPDELQFLEVQEPNATTFTRVTNPKDYISKGFSLKKNASITITLKAKVIKSNGSSVKNTACTLSTGEGTTAGSCDDEITEIKEVCPTNPALAKDSSECQPPCPVPGKESLPQNSPDCKPCDETKQDQNGKDISCLSLHKTARNITQDINNANGTTAHGGDTIEYTLSVTNLSKQVRKGFIIEENMGDVLEYADIIDASGAKFSEIPVKMLSWQPVDIQPNQTIKRTVLIKIKSPIPKTPASTSDPLSHDMKLVNTYGDTVQIQLPATPIKTVERTVSTLPSTGLGTNIFISTILLAVATYFYFRSQLMVKELVLVRQQFNYGAGI